MLESLSCAIASGVVYLDPTEAILSRNQSRECMRFETRGGGVDLSELPLQVPAPHAKELF